MKGAQFHIIQIQKRKEKKRKDKERQIPSRQEHACKDLPKERF